MDKKENDILLALDNISLDNDIEQEQNINFENLLNEIWTENIKEKKSNLLNWILFVTKYQLLKISEDVVGAFYWKKGRSQLLFIKKRLERHNIKLPTEYQNFMIDALWEGHTLTSS